MTFPSRLLAVVGAGALAVGVAACGSSNDNKSSSTSGGASTTSSSGGGTINGAGSTFQAPVVMQWGSNLKGQGITVNYQAIGSGAGVAQLTQGTVDFAGSDPPLKDDEIKALKGGEATHVPIVLGAITVSYNLSGQKSGLKLDGKTLADIYLGKVKKWNDPEIAQQNPGVSLPSSNIVVVHRSDSSGTTKGFTTFLSDYSSEWKSKVGADKDVKWPTGTGAKGNDGVAGAIKQTPDSIGYVEQAYALQNNFSYASVKNKAGKYIAPTIASTSAAADGITVPSDLRIEVINSSSPSGYPITSQSFVIVPTDVCKNGGMSTKNAKALKTFLDYGLGAGQNVAKQLSYAPLPSNVLSKAKQAVGELKCNGSPIS